MPRKNENGKRLLIIVKPATDKRLRDIKKWLGRNSLGKAVDFLVEAFAK